MADEARINIGELKPGDVALLRDLAEASAEKAVKKTLTELGIDTVNPLKSQRDFAFLRKVTHDGGLDADFEWMRRARRREERWGKIILAAIVAGLGGAINFAWNLFQLMMGRH